MPPGTSIQILPAPSCLISTIIPSLPTAWIYFSTIFTIGIKTAGTWFIFSPGSGCPYRCIFCAQHAINRGRIRERSAENIFAEMEKLFERGFRKFAIVQETFLRDPRRVDRFCSRIESSGLPVEWTIEARADQLDFEKLSRMKNAGLRFVQLGVESGDQDLLNTLGKNINLTK